MVWPDFDQALVENEVAEGRQFKLLIDGAIACVWAVAFRDPQIWEERDRDPALYIHRIATAPQFRGRTLVKHLVQWAKVYAEKQQKKFVRLDTLGENTRLIAYYQEMGFNFLGIFPLKTQLVSPRITTIPPLVCLKYNCKLAFLYINKNSNHKKPQPHSFGTNFCSFASSHLEHLPTKLFTAMVF